MKVKITKMDPAGRGSGRYTIDRKNHTPESNEGFNISTPPQEVIVGDGNQELEQIHYRKGKMGIKIGHSEGVEAYFREDYFDMFCSGEFCDTLTVNARRLQHADIGLDSTEVKRFVARNESYKWQDEGFWGPNVPIIFVPNKIGIEKIARAAPKIADSFCIRRKGNLYMASYYIVKDLGRSGMYV